MDVYVFLQTRPGEMGSVMNAVVEEGLADRAVAVTGTWDVVARRENLTWEELNSLVVDKIGRVPGVVRSYTAVVIPTELVAKLNPDGLPINIQDPGGLTFAGLSTPVADVLQRLHGIKGVRALALLTGDWDLLIQVYGETIEEVATTVLNEIREVPGITRTSTSLILRGTEVRERKGGRPSAPKRAPAKKKPAAKRARTRSKDR